MFTCTGLSCHLTTGPFSGCAMHIRAVYAASLLTLHKSACVNGSIIFSNGYSVHENNKSSHTSSFTYIGSN